MPKRPSSHVVADIAVNAVMGVFAACGWAGEVVHKDYGDDLFVQTTHKGIVDHNRIWVQVKGTQKLEQFLAKKDNAYRFKVPIGHALKWVRSADLVVFVLWDTRRQMGVWTLPKEQLRGWDCYVVSASNVYLRFKPDDKFDANSAAKIGWLARIDYYSNLISRAQIQDYDCRLTGNSVLPTGPNLAGGQHLTQLPFILCDFFRLLSIMDEGEEGSVTPAFLTRFRDSCSLIRSSFKDAPEEKVEEMAIILALLTQVAVASGVKGCGISASVLELLSFVSLKLVRDAL
jgi:hypothetical protein